MVKYKEMTSRCAHPKGFTLLEILLVVGIIGILAAIVIVALNPTRQLAQTRNSGRKEDIKTISNAISQYQIDHNGALPAGIDGTLRVIGSASSGCAVTCQTQVAMVPASSASGMSLAQVITAASQPLLALFPPTSVAHAAGSTGWVLPASDQEPGGQWTQTALAYDNNIGTYAVNTYGGAGWGQYIVFSLANPIVSDRVRINADYLDSLVSQVEVDVLKDGIWYTAFVGGDQATWNDKWVTVTFPKGTVTQARFRYNYSGGGYYFWLNEFQFYQSAPTVMPPSCSSLPAASVQGTSAVVRGSVTDDGGEPVQYRFQYGTSAAYDTSTSWAGSSVTGNTFSSFVSGLTSYTTYHVQGQVQNSAGTASCGDMTFTTNPSGQDWLPPSGGSDATGQWTDISLAGDGDTATYAGAYHDISAAQWSSYLYLNFANILANGVRFYARGGSEVSQVEIDLFDGSNWTVLYQGPFADQQWVTQLFPQQMVSQVRVRFYATNANAGFFWNLSELNVQKLADVSDGSCLNLSPQLVPVYLPSMPTDPSTGTAANTYYAVRNEGNNRVAVYACGAELDQTLKAVR